MKRYRKLLLLLCACMVTTLLGAQEAKTLFVALPDSLSPLLTKVNREDCIDFLESKMRAEVENRFGTKTEMTQLSADYISLQLSPQTTWQMKMLPIEGADPVVCTVSTACAPVCDSRLTFYTTAWQPLATATYISLPTVEDFLLPPTDPELLPVYEEACRAADMLLMQADLSPQGTELCLRLTTPDYLPKETAEKLLPFLCRELVYRWQQGAFVR